VVDTRIAIEPGVAVLSNTVSSKIGMRNFKVHLDGIKEALLNDNMMAYLNED